MPVRVLVVDDDRISTEIIAKALTASGFAVDTARSGFDAVALIKKNSYDLALVDYQMPELDGLTSAKIFRSVGDTKTLPKLVAITSDVSSLKARDDADEIFHAILPKPLKPDAIVSYVDQAFRNSERGHLFEAAATFWRRHGFAGRPRAVAIPAPAPEQALALSLCFEAAADDGADADAILITDESASAALEEMRANAASFLLPLIDVTGRCAALADASFNVAVPDSWQETAQAIAAFARNRRRLVRTHLPPGDIEGRLLAYLFVTEKPFAPRRDASALQCVRYPGCFPAEAAAAAARLERRGLLSKTFVDRFHACASCGSHRLNVREECPSCRSPDIEETALIHHFPCAMQAPEAQFRTATHLVCPKCRATLRHYGKDYDKPGNVLLCAACGAWNSEAAVGFSCLDCGAHVDGEKTPCRDVFAYRLTPRALKALTLRLGALPAPGVPAPVATALATMGPPRSGARIIVEVVYGAERRLIERLGVAAFDKLRRQFLENLGNALQDYASVIAGEEADFVIVDDEDRDSLPAFLDRAFRVAEEILSERLLAACRVLDIPEATGRP